MLPARDVQLEDDGQGECLSHGLVEPDEARGPEFDEALDVVLIDAQRLDSCGDGVGVDALETERQRFC